MNNQQVKSFVLLMASDLGSLMKKNHVFSDETASNFHVNIYKENLELDKYNDTIKNIIGSYWRQSAISTFDIGRFILYSFSKTIEKQEDMLVIQRLAFLTNKVFHIKWHFDSLSNNHRQLLQQQDEYLSFDFEPKTAQLKSSGRKRSMINSEENINMLKDAFSKARESHFPLNTFILENLPYSEGLNSSIKNVNKINASFKKILKREVWHYISQLSLNKGEVDQVIGFLFASIRLCRHLNEFYSWQKEKDPELELSVSDYYEYLRTESRNV